MGRVRALTWTAPIWAALALMAWWWWIDYQPWNPFGGPPSSDRKAEVLTPVVSVNGTVQIKLDYNIRRDNCSRDIQVWQGNSTQKLLASHAASTSGEGNGERHRVVSYPASAHPGREYIKFRAVWRCNPLKTWNEVWDPVWYEVVED